MIRTVSLISGGGSTNLAILQEQKPGGRLHGLIETTAIISNNAKAGGIKKALGVGFPEENIHTVSRVKGDLGEQIIQILGRYQPDWFHQLGWLPLTPKNVLAKYKGLNQHLGPGGRYMFGAARIYTHMRFCEVIGQSRPLPVFCQRVAVKLDDGDVIALQNETIEMGETVGEVARRVLPVEHEMQICALEKLATGQALRIPVPRVYQTLAEEKLMDSLRLEAHNFFALAEEDALNYRYLKPEN